MTRRAFLQAAGALAGATGVSGCSWWPDQGLTNPCKAGRLPADLAAEPLLRAAWADIDPAEVWDCHAHLFGNGDSGGGVWINPAMYRLSSPLKLMRRRFFENAACVSSDRPPVDAQVVARLVELLDGMRESAAHPNPGQPKALLFAFDWRHDEGGRPDRDGSSFHVPDAYTRSVALAHPAHFEWAASIHPYRADAIDALEEAAAGGARAVKWLPSAMAIDPASPLCDRFYAAASRLSLPLICHAGEELAVDGGAQQHYGNPLKLRRALDAGIRVVVAHCASAGVDEDLDHGGKAVSSFELFTRLMDDTRYDALLFADISALPQINRAGILGTVLERTAWHRRLLQGSDYPLPGVLPLVSLGVLVERGLLDAAAVPVLRRLREHNALLFDFVLKRSVRAQGRGFGDGVFATRSFFMRAPARPGS